MNENGNAPLKSTPTESEIQMYIDVCWRPSPFGASLADLMQHPAKTHPDADVPWIMTRMMSDIRSSGGQKQPGLFRIKAKPEEVQALRASYEKDPSFVYDKSTNPHVPATLLKEWLRELADPVIPRSLYNRFVELAQSADAILALIQELPEVNQNVLFHLLALVQYVSVHDDNLMDSHALAVMLSPSLFRCPETDLMLVAKLTAVETMAVETMIDSLVVFV